METSNNMKIECTTFNMSLGRKVLNIIVKLLVSIGDFFAELKKLVPGSKKIGSPQHNAEKNICKLSMPNLRLDVPDLSNPSLSHDNYVEKYISKLNSDIGLIPSPSNAECDFLDEGLMCSVSDPDKSKDLSTKYLISVLSELKCRPHSMSLSRHCRSVVPFLNKKRSKVDYATIQYLYKTDKKAVYKRLFDNNSIDHSLNAGTVFDFWTSIFTKTDYTELNFDPSFVIDTSDFVSGNLPSEVCFVSPAEVIKNKLPFSTTEGPDGVSIRNLNEIPIRALCKLYTCWIILKWTPSFILDSRTIFLPKKPNSNIPAELRPISIASVLCRQFHKILAFRLSVKLSIDCYQFAFKSSDGIAKCINLVDNVLSSHESMPVSLCMMDLEKAFDSVSHSAIFEALNKAGVCCWLIDYLRFVYSSSRTFMQFFGSVSEPVRPSRGVRQGDPLSPFLFNLVFDKVLAAIPLGEGVSVNHENVSKIAYADDLIILSPSIHHLQCVMEKIISVLSSCGLKVNLGKSFVISWYKDTEMEKIVYNDRHSIRVYDQHLQIMPVNSIFKYLGVDFTTTGRAPLTSSELEDKLQILMTASLKPQQKLFFLLRFLLPSFYHRFTFGCLNAGTLKKLDNCIRKFIHAILHLPNDVPKAFYYASVEDGGLGVPCFRWWIPLLAQRRGVQVQSTLMKCKGIVLDTKISINNMFKCSLNSSYRRKGLDESPACSEANKWITDGTSLLSGKDYISALHVQYNALFSESTGPMHRPSKYKVCGVSVIYRLVTIWYMFYFLLHRD